MIRASKKLTSNSFTQETEIKYLQAFLLKDRVANPNWDSSYCIWDRICAEELLCHREAIEASDGIKVREEVQ